MSAKATIDSPISVVDCQQQYTQSLEKLPSNIYHSLAWKRVADLYGLPAHWLVAQLDGKPIGLLPLVCQSSRLFGARLISLPWVDEAGAIGDDKAVLALLEQAKYSASENGLKFSLSIKQPIGCQLPDIPKGWVCDSGDKVLVRRRLAMSSDELWEALSAKVRNQVRKAEKSGLVTERGSTELLQDFFDVYSRNMRDLGSPSHSLKFFRTLVEALEGRASIYCTRLKGKAIGAGLVLDNRSSLDIPWASSLREYNRLCVNHSLYWKILSDACDSGYNWFHFGRSTIGSGQYKFKKQWGATETPLLWLTYSQSPRTSGFDNPATAGEKFGLTQKIWAKLPLWFTRWMGPHIIRHLP